MDKEQEVKKILLQPTLLTGKPVMHELMASQFTRQICQLFEPDEVKGDKNGLLTDEERRKIRDTIQYSPFIKGHFTPEEQERWAKRYIDKLLKAQRDLTASIKDSGQKVKCEICQAKFLGEKADFGLSVNEVAFALSESICRKRVERIFKKIENDNCEHCLYAIALTTPDWQALKKQEGIK